MARFGSIARAVSFVGSVSLSLAFAGCGSAASSEATTAPASLPAEDGADAATLAETSGSRDAVTDAIDAAATDPAATDAAPVDAAIDAVIDAPPAAPRAPTRTVLLIPGTAITGDYFDTMAARLRADGFLPVVYEPADLLTGGLADGAAAIGDVVDAELRKSGEARLHVVAECNGGVATRYWLQLLGGHPKVDQAVTFVSAHHGTWESPIGSFASGFQSLRDITPGSDFLAKLNAAPYPPSLHLTSIYSCNDELMVPYTTSVVAGATNVLFCDHYVGHLDGFSDALVYERILATLRGKGDAAPTRY